MANISINVERLVFPGDKIECYSEDVLIGTGVHVNKGFFIASLVGHVSFSSINEGKVCISVVPPGDCADDTVLKVGDKVMCRATKLSMNQTNVDIISVGDKELKQVAKGVIRREDIQTSEIDTIVMSNSFRPGDLIRAKVISMGDSRNFYCSTSESDCGVRFARSQIGNLMRPISWKEMQDIFTGKIEARKSAKPETYF